MRGLRRAGARYTRHRACDRYARIFLAYHMAVTGHIPQLLEYGLTQEAQYRLRDEVTDRLSATISFEAVYKALLVGDGSHVLPANTPCVEIPECLSPSLNLGGRLPTGPAISFLRGGRRLRRKRAQCIGNNWKTAIPCYIFRTNSRSWRTHSLNLFGSSSGGRQGTGGTGKT